MYWEKISTLIFYIKKFFTNVILSVNDCFIFTKSIYLFHIYFTLF